MNKMQKKLKINLEAVRERFGGRDFIIKAIA